MNCFSIGEDVLRMVHIAPFIHRHLYIFHTPDTGYAGREGRGDKFVGGREDTNQRKRRQTERARRRW